MGVRRNVALVDIVIHIGLPLGLILNGSRCERAKQRVHIRDTTWGGVQHVVVEDIHALKRRGAGVCTTGGRVAERGIRGGSGGPTSNVGAIIIHGIEERLCGEKRP